MFITDWPMSLKQRLPGSDESRRGKVERSGVKEVVVHLKGGSASKTAAFVVALQSVISASAMTK